jgi:predicted lysophospholipase L1 biosynthesis ABC-type transport system permease subunit
VVVVNQAFANRYWPGRDPIGLRLTQAQVEYTVVGLVRDGKYRRLTERPFPLIYRSFAQNYQEAPTIHVRAKGNAKALIPALRKEFAAVDPNLPFLDPRTMREHMQQSTIGQEIGSKSLAAFGAIALLLAAIGIYGVMSYAVSQRTREIGVRVALGAAVGDVTGMVVRDGLKITLVGAAVGAVGAIGAGRMLQGLLLGVSPTDPLTFGTIGLVITAVTVAACLVPARRAARVDPTIALRSQ